jgi:hypothetical protein
MGPRSRHTTQEGEVYFGVKKKDVQINSRTTAKYLVKILEEPGINVYLYPQ